MKQMEPENMLLTPVTLQQYFQDLSNILIELHSDDMELTDRFISEPIEVWVPSNHDYILIRNEITSLDYENEVTTTINTMIRRTQLNQSALEKLTYPEIEKELKDEINYLLFQMNYQQERFGDFYFISKLAPSKSKVENNINQFREKVYNALDHSLLPQIADTMFSDEMTYNEVYSVKISDPLLNFSKDPNIKDSFLSLNIDIINSNMEPMINNSITLQFNYLDYSNFAWIYANDNNGINKITMDDYIKITNEVIEEYVQKKQILKYDKVSLLLVDYNGLSARDQFVSDNSTDLNNDTINLFNEMVQNGEFSDFIKNVSPMNTENNVYRISCNTNDDKPLTLFVGPGGISSAEYGPIYGVNKDLGSIRVATRKLTTLLGFSSNQVSSFTALYDKRRVKKIMQDHQEKLLEGGE